MPDHQNNRRWGKASVTFQTTTGETKHIIVSGRMLWALEQLLEAGERGCTPIDTPGPRWSNYVFKLRNESVEIETITENHVGPFAGTHARYVLRSLIVSMDAAGEVAA